MSKKEEILDANWENFLKWAAFAEGQTVGNTRSLHTGPGGATGKTEKGFLINEEWMPLPVEDNFWLWYVQIKLKSE